MNKKVAVVTGGAGDIGADICNAFLYAGYDVVSLDLAHGPQGVESIICSVTDRFVLANALKTVECDVLVNAAGITKDTFLHKMTEDKWDDVMSINLTGMYNVTRAVIEGMRSREYGRIVNISSVNGSKGQFGQCNYSASKAGVHGFTMALAQEGARKNIMVNTISPGYIDTRMTQVIEPKVRDHIVSTIPAGRMGVPADVSRVVLFLADESNTYITGANIPVNGGLFTSL